MFGNPVKAKETKPQTKPVTSTVTDEDNDRLFNQHTADTTRAQNEQKQLQSTVDNLPWVEKYRPNDMTELISHTDIINTINKLIDVNKLPHLLFYGPPGTSIGSHYTHMKHGTDVQHNVLVCRYWQDEYHPRSCPQAKRRQVPEYGTGAERIGRSWYRGSERPNQR